MWNEMESKEHTGEDVDFMLGFLSLYNHFKSFNLLNASSGEAIY